jgi:DNA polymerase I-like protein with 3'-5' exonuclease and polymerase domains
MLAVTRLHAKLTQRGWGHILFFVHDSIAFEIKEAHLEEAVALIRADMEGALDEIQAPDFYVPFPVDIEVGRGWGDLYPEKDKPEDGVIGWCTRYLAQQAA